MERETEVTAAGPYLLERWELVNSDAPADAEWLQRAPLAEWFGVDDWEVVAAFTDRASGDAWVARIIEESAQ